MTALAKAQGQIQDIERDRAVKVQPRSGGQAYEFKYATLSAIIKGIKKALSDNGIAYTQVLTFETNDRLYYLTTSLHHKNQFISSVTPLIIGGDTGNQQFGSALTYMKRYTLAALVGVAADEDDDGNAADGNEVQAMQAAVNKATKKVAPDPIKEPVVVTRALTGDISFPGDKVDTTELPDGAVDWMAWGKAFMEKARAAQDMEALFHVQKANALTLDNMEKDAPKMFSNLMVSLIRVRSALERK